MRALVLVLIVALPLTAFLAFAAGDVLLPHPWSKQPRHAGSPVVKLPSAIVTTAAPAVPLPMLGSLAAAVPLTAPSTVPRPPFVPPRA